MNYQKKDVREVAKIIKTLKDCEVPEEENILEWDLDQLKAYIFKKTKGMSVKKKMKFAKKLNERIKTEKEKYINKQIV